MSAECDLGHKLFRSEKKKMGRILELNWGRGRKKTGRPILVASVRTWRGNYSWQKGIKNLKKGKKSKGEGG